jgi:nucleotide-binding universal stress UspA family protein
MALYRRILVPLDGTDVDHAILAHVAELAHLCGAEVILLRVAHYHTRDSRTAEQTEAKEYSDAAVAAGATAVVPAAVGLLLVQSLAGRRMPDFVTPLVAALYSQDRLAAAAAARLVEEAAVAGEALPAGPRA